MVQLMPLHPQTPSSLASFESRLVLPFQVVVEKRPLNGYFVVVVTVLTLLTSRKDRHRALNSCLLYMSKGFVPKQIEVAEIAVTSEMEELRKRRFTGKQLLKCS